MLKMHGDGGGRRSEEDIKQQALTLYQADLVAGFAEVSEWGRAHREREWVASFTDARSAYYIHQDGRDHLQFWTEEIPAGTGARWVVFVFSVGTGMGSIFPQPSGQFEVRLNLPPGGGAHLISFNVTKESRVWRQGDVTLAYDIKRHAWARQDQPLKMDAHITEESAATYGIMALKVPKDMLPEGGRARIDVVPVNRQPSRRWFKVDVDMFARPIFKCDIEAALAAACERPQPPRAGADNVYFGDLHAHTGEEHGSGRTCGTGTLDENYLYARDVAGLDVFAVAEHDWQIHDEADWNQRMEQMDQYNEDGRFVVIPAYEWTSLKYGHRNVYYRDTGWPFFKNTPPGTGHNAITDESRSPADLWQALRECGARALTIAHHPSTGFFPVDWSYQDPEFDRLVEVYSTWGNSEYYGARFPGYAADRHEGMGALDALQMGHRLGFMASSDGHDGNPGNAQWCYRQPHIHHRLGSGFIGVLAPELTRAAIFDAMYERRCYATTGTRIVLDFRVNEARMGEVIPGFDGEDRFIEGEVIGTAPIEWIEVVHNDELIYGEGGRDRRHFQFATDDCDAEGGGFYRLRVFQTDGEMAWSSPIWVDVGATTPGGPGL